MCDLCGYEAASKKILRSHIQTEHEGVRYECEQCDYVAKSSGTLRRHQQSVHEGKKYPCDQCTYMATAPNALKRHIQSIHEQAGICLYFLVRNSRLFKGLTIMITAYDSCYFSVQILIS
jgi:predicted RNA-binding Zn-ribbon protein involved in translation (DUF1610 family)